ncbi:MAG: 30S ribosomal protein S17 [archaeon]|nr:MAG: 30S ribosomal protein S17 [archaeon]
MEKKTKKESPCRDKNCPFHGKLSARGRTFKGNIIKIIGSRAAIGFERSLYYPKYDRYAKAKTKLHAHIPECMLKQLKVGNIIKITECRPLSKIVHFVVTEKIK